MLSNQIEFEPWQAGNSTANEAFDGVRSILPMLLAVASLVAAITLWQIIIAFSRTTSSGVDDRLMQKRNKAQPSDSQSTGVDAAPLFTPKDFQR